MHVEVGHWMHVEPADWYTWRLTLETRGALLTGTRGRLTLELAGAGRCTIISEKNDNK